jgi:ComF family protein
MAFTDVKSWPVLRGILEFAFPPLCLGCDELVAGQALVCSRCLKQIDYYEQPLCVACLELLDQQGKCLSCDESATPLYALAQYESPVREIIHKLKFESITTPATLLARLWCERFGEMLTERNPDVIAPIPLRPGREYWRGYNQAALLAEQIAERLSLVLHDTLMVRTGGRRPQSKLKLDQRAANVAGVYALADEVREDNRRVVLVDDVVTSGSTMREALSVCAESGFDVVACVAMAHGM